MSRSVLLTAAKEDTEVFRSKLQQKNATVLHYPLERYCPVENDTGIVEALEHLEDFENIVHGSKRNAQYFIKKLKEYDKLSTARNRLNLAMDQHTADFLEEEGIPAVHPQVEGIAINLMEFMLRLQRLGETLYPCGDKTKESLPGLLQELDMPVQELVCFTLEGPEEEKLKKYHQSIASHEPSIIVFHSRRSVNRILAAFPTLDFKKPCIISGDQAVSDKLEKKKIPVDIQAKGSWESIMNKVIENS